MKNRNDMKKVFLLFAVFASIPLLVKAIGYKKGKKVMEERVETTLPASRAALSADRHEILADGMDVAVCTLRLLDKKNRFVPDACESVDISVSGPVRILGVGNGDSAWQDKDRPEDPGARHFQVKTFNGLAQILLQNTGESGEASMTVKGTGIEEAQIVIKSH